MKKINQILEMEIGVTGGVEDGVNNEGVSNDKLYTTPETVFSIHEALSALRTDFGPWDSFCFRRCVPQSNGLCAPCGSPSTCVEARSVSAVNRSCLVLLWSSSHCARAARSKIDEKFTIAAAFGNVHGVYKPGNVVLKPELLVLPGSGRRPAQRGGGAPCLLNWPR